jgi:hypothetical protein
MRYCEGDFYRIAHFTHYILHTNNALIWCGIVRAQISCSMKSTPIYVELIRNNTPEIDAHNEISDVMYKPKTAARYAFKKNISESFLRNITTCSIQLNSAQFTTLRSNGHIP